MKTLNLLSLVPVLLAALVPALAREEARENDGAKPPVVDWHAYEHASADMFNRAMQARPYNLVAFTSPNDFESQKLEWSWPAIKKQEPNVLSVDCDSEPDLCLDHDVRTYPAVRLYRQGKLYARYRGARNADEILAFTNRTTKPLISTLDASGVSAFSESDSVTFILHLRPQDADGGLYARFQNLAREFYDRYSFAVVGRDADNSADEEGEDAPSVLRCFNNLDDVQGSFDDFWVDIVEGCGRRVVREMTGLDVEEFVDGPRMTLLYFDADPAARASFASSVLALAKAQSHALDFVTVDPLAHSAVVEKVGLPWVFPAMALRNPATRTIQLFNKGDIDQELVARFVAGSLGISEAPAMDGEGEGDGDGEAEGETDETVITEDDGDHDREEEAEPTSHENGGPRDEL